MECLVVGRLRGQEFERPGFRVIEKLRDRDMGVSEAEFSKPRSWGCQMVWRLRVREFERPGFKVIEKLRDWDVGVS